MYQEKIGKKRVVTFSSISDFTRIKDDPNCLKIQQDSVERRLANDSPSELERWFGCSSRAEYEEILANGHPRYVQMINKKMQCPAPKSIRRRLQFKDQGDEVCIHKINSGNLSTAWRSRSPRARTGSKSIRLVVNLGANCSVESKELQWVGVTTLTVAHAAELAGYNVAIDGFYGSIEITCKEDILMFFPIKQYEMPLDIQSLSSVLCYARYLQSSGRSSADIFISSTPLIRPMIFSASS